MKSYQYYLYFTVNRVYFLVSKCSANANTNAEIILLDEREFLFQDLTKQSSLISAVEIIDDMCNKFTEKEDGVVFNSVNILLDTSDVKMNNFRLEIPCKTNVLSYQDVFAESFKQQPTFENYYLAQVVVDTFDPSTGILFSQTLNHKIKSKIANFEISGYYLPKNVFEFYYNLFSKTYVKVNYWLLLSLTIYDFISNQFTASDLNQECYVVYLGEKSSVLYKYDNTGKLLNLEKISFNTTDFLTTTKTLFFEEKQAVSLENVAKLVNEYGQIGVDNKYLNRYFNFLNVFFKTNVFFDKFQKLLEDTKSKLVNQLGKYDFDKDNHKLFLFNTTRLPIDITTLLTSQSLQTKPFFAVKNVFTEFDDNDYIGLFSSLNYTCNILNKQFECQLSHKSVKRKTIFKNMFNNNDIKEYLNF